MHANNLTSGLSDYIVASRYARFSPELGRRETWGEAVARVADMHKRRFPSVSGLIEEAFASVSRKEVLPSMRSLQFGGAAVEANHARLYNCASSYIDRIDFFREAFWLLLSGTGVGFSVQRCHVSKLPALPVFAGDVSQHVVADTIEGWADSLDFLLRCHLNGGTAEFDYSAIRPEGTPLKTSGGKAPGAEPLRTALDAVRKVLVGAAGRSLKPIEAYDIMMFTAKAVLSGGIRRSATICLFSVDDEEMLHAKTGDWFGTNPQRSASNNSAVLVRGKVTRAQFDALFIAQKQFGEPGVYFSESEDYVCNPCVEIGIHPRLLLTRQSMAKLRAYGYMGELTPGTYLSGWQLCNLSTVSANGIESPGEFYRRCRMAAVIGTVQASYTSFSYLGPVSRLITETEALLGVSICGFLDNPDVLMQPSILERGAAIVKSTNAEVARLIGIRPAARCTTTKPEGTASILLNTGSGIHPHHARRYFRRVQGNVNDPVFAHFAALNPHMVETSVYDASGKTGVITFLVEGPESGIYRDDLSALEFLGMVSTVQQHWVEAGRQYDHISPGLHHNVSNTVTVRPNEWEQVANYIWDHRGSFTGISMLPFSGDKDYKQAPKEAVACSEDEARWTRILAGYQEVNFTELAEKVDSTSLKGIVACSGGACELV